MKGGAFLWANAQEDYEAGLISFKEVLRKLSLIKKFEANELSLRGLNCIWLKED